MSQEHLVAPEPEVPVPAEVLEDGTVEEVWMVSSRGISCPSEDLTGLKFYERVDEQWVDTPAADFHDRLMDDRLNMLFVHGNRTDIQYASLRGLQAYQSFVRDQNPGVPTRYIIWAWPSEQMAGPIKDFRIKANRANQEGRLFGSFLSRFPSDSQLSLIAYSYGSRIVLGGMQLLSGQPLLGRRLDLQEGFSPPSMRVTLIAAAAGNSSLLPRRQYGDAYDLMDRLLLINNTSDRALKLYRWLDRRSKISALGRGIAGRSMLADGGARIIQRDFANEIGHEHSLLGYFRSRRIRALVREQIFWIEEEPADATTISVGSTSRRR